MPKSLSLVVDLGIEPSIKNSALLRDRLAAALRDHDAITVSGEQIASLDISVLQLVVAAHRSALAAGKTLSVTGLANPVLHQALQRVGFVDGSGAALSRDSDLWTHSLPAKEDAA